MSIRILIADHYWMVREGLRMFLGRDPDLDIVGEAADGKEAVEKARYLQPDVVLMDLLLPVMDGIAAISAICHELPGTAVIALTCLAERGSVIKAIRAGAASYLLKDTQAEELQKVIKEVAAGHIYLSSQVSTYLLHEIQAPSRQALLTERETEVLDLLVQGLSNKDIAHTLQIVEDTVKTHVRHILTKLHVRSRTQAILAAMRMGLVAYTLKAPSGRSLNTAGSTTRNSADETQHYSPVYPCQNQDGENVDESTALS